jgi:predicted amidophosphoribosyltransferase
LIRNGFGKTVQECLKRVIPLPKSATSFAGDRPKAVQHCDSIEIESISPEPEEILLIDDIVTRGATFLGSANKLKVVFPRSHVRAFAAMRTISSPGEFKRIIDPCLGNITLEGQETTRRP